MTVPLPGDPRLYVLDGVRPSQITWEVREETLRRWREWRMAKEEGNALRARIAALRVVPRSGDLCQQWDKALKRVVAKYSRLDQAQKTGLPLSLDGFEEKSGTRGMLADDAYRRILLSANPFDALAEA